MRDVITVDGLRFFLAMLIGIAVAAVFGILIGIPVLRLKGDYLAIVTLAFGEIIKNLVNVLFIGKDANGFHFSLKDILDLDMEPDGTVIVNGPQGITEPLRIHVFNRLYHDPDQPFCDPEPDQFEGRTRDHGDPRQPDRCRVHRHQYYKIQADAFTVSAALAGSAGVLYAHNLSTLTANTNNFGYNSRS